MKLLRPRAASSQSCGPEQRWTADGLGVVRGGMGRLGLREGAVGNLDSTPEPDAERPSRRAPLPLQYLPQPSELRHGVRNNKNISSSESLLVEERGQRNRELIEITIH